MKNLIMMIGAAVVAVGANAGTVTTNGATWTYTVVDSSASPVTVQLGNGSAACIATDTSIDAANIPWTFTDNGVDYIVTKLGKNSFQNCTGLTGTLAIPAAVTNIGQTAFNGCTGLTGISSFGGLAENNRPGASVFSGCSGLMGTLVVPDAYSGGFSSSSFNNCDGLTAIIVGSGTSDTLQNFATACDNLIGVWVKGRPDSAGKTTLVYSDNAFQNSSSLRVVLYGNNAKLSDSSSHQANPVGGVTGCKIFVPTKEGRVWDKLVVSGTGNEAIPYGANTNLNLVVDEVARTITFTPTDTNALVKVLEAAPHFKEAFGWNTKINITNTIEVAEGMITAEMLNAVEFNTLLLTFAVRTQAQLDDILAKFPASTYPMLAIDVKPSAPGKTEALTLPSDRELWVHLPGDGKFTPKYNGLIISFY